MMRLAASIPAIFWLSLVLLASQCFEVEPARAESSDPARLRVATLMPLVEDALRYANREAEVVASVRRSLHSPLKEGLVDLGNPHAPSLERLAEAQPDLVIGDRGIHAALAEAVGNLGLKLLLVETSSIPGTLNSLEQISKAVGGSRVLEERVAALERSLAGLRVAEPVRVLPLFGSPGAFYVMTERAWLGDLATQLGMTLALDGPSDERFPGMVAASDEAIAMTRPDLVLLVAHGDPRKIRADLERRTEGRGAWSSLADARLGVHVLDPDLFSANPGLELARAAKRLVGLVNGTETAEAARTMTQP